MQSNEIIFRVFSEAGKIRYIKSLGINRVEIPISSKFKELKERVKILFFKFVFNIIIIIQFFYKNIIYNCPLLY